MKTVRKKVFVIIIFAVFLLVSSLIFGTWFIAIPNDVLVHKIESYFVKSPFSVKVDNLRKGLLFNLKIEKVQIERNNSRIDSVHHIRLDMNPFYLLFKTVKVSFNATFGGGQIEGKAIIEKGSTKVKAKFSNLKIQDMDYAKLLGIKGKGTLSGTVRLEGSSGTVRFVVRESQLEDVYKHDTYLPLSFFSEIKGLLSIEKKVINLKSISCEGKDVFARIKGMIKNGSANVVLEVMPEHNFSEMDMLSLIKKYEISPGFYSIPIRKKLY